MPDSPLPPRIRLVFGIDEGVNAHVTPLIVRVYGDDRTSLVDDSSYVVRCQWGRGIDGRRGGGLAENLIFVTFPPPNFSSAALAKWQYPPYNPSKKRNIPSLTRTNRPGDPPIPALHLITDKRLHFSPDEIIAIVKLYLSQGQPGFTKDHAGFAEEGSRASFLLDERHNETWEFKGLDLQLYSSTTQS